MGRLRKIKQITEDFNKEVILEKISPLTIEQVDGVVATNWNGSGKSVSVSNRYKVVDFKEIVHTMLEDIETVFTPLKYRLDIYGGRQELKLQGESINIGGDVYHKVIYLLNSSDKSRALQMNIGFVREKNNSGIIVNVNSVSKVHLSARHFKGLNLSDKIASFFDNLSNCEELFNLQSEKIIKLNYSKVKLSYIAEVLNADKNAVKFDVFKYMLLNSRTDKVLSLTTDEYNAIRVPYSEMLNESLDFEISGYVAFQCYAEMWASYDSHIINRETSRMMDIIIGNDDNEKI